jgi:hypothetical protein
MGVFVPGVGVVDDEPAHAYSLASRLRQSPRHSFDIEDPPPTHRQKTLR